MPAFLAPIIAGLWAAFSRIMFRRGGKWLLAILATIGIDILISGGTALLFRGEVISAMQGIPAEIASWMGVLKIDVYVSIILSAHGIAHLKQAGHMRLVRAGRR